MGEGEDVDDLGRPVRVDIRNRTAYRGRSGSAPAEEERIRTHPVRASVPAQVSD